MSPTPDRRAGTRYEERLRLTSDEGLSSDVAGDVTFDGTDFSMRDSVGAFNPRTGGGISETQHEALDTLAHDLTESHTVTYTRTAGKLSQVLAEVTPAGTDIRSAQVLTRTGAGKVNTLRVIQYQSDGVTIERQLDITLNRTAGKVTSMTVTRTT